MRRNRRRAQEREQDFAGSNLEYYIVSLAFLVFLGVVFWSEGLTDGVILAAVSSLLALGLIGWEYWRHWR
jgi:hypothetical protein